MEPDVAPLTRLARRQHGLFTSHQAAGCGLTRDALRRLVWSRWCARLGEGVYRIEGAPRSAAQDLLAAVLVHRVPAAGSHRAAAAHWGIPGYGGRPEVTVVHARNRRTPLGRIHGTLRLPPHHVTVRHGVPVTTIARTIFDLAGVVPELRAEQALDFALSRKLCTLRQVNEVFFVLAGQGRRGTVAMRSLLDARGEGYVPPASELERVGRRLFAEGGLPEPEFEVHLGDDQLIGRVDCLWRAAQPVVVAPAVEQSSREADRIRNNRLMAAGWRVLRFTWDDLTLRPQQTLATIRAALAR